jgi:hypothetical protein
MANNLEFQKNQLLDQLSKEYSTDAITLDEYERLITSVTNAETETDLVTITQSHGISSSSYSLQSGQSRSLSSPGEFKESRSSVAIFSGSELKGSFKAARKHNALAVFGGVEIDLRKAIIPPEGISIDAAAVFGGVEITVPPNVHVECSGFAILGGFDTKEHEARDVNAPRVRVTGFAVFGGVEVRVK